MGIVTDFVSREAKNAWNMYAANAAERWEEIYARGFGEMLDGRAQRARHYVIAGMVADHCGRAPAVLDVGAGFGTTYELLRPLSPRYVGIDLSARAVARCRDRFGGDPGATFEVAAFEGYDPGRGFDAVILNEVLQYFPLSRCRSVVDKAVSHLAGAGGLLVISLSGLGKSLLVWAALRGLPPPSQRVSLRTRRLALLGGRWVVKGYGGLSAAPGR